MQEEGKALDNAGEINEQEDMQKLYPNIKPEDFEEIDEVFEFIDKDRDG